MARRPSLEVSGARNLRRTLKAAGIELTDLKKAHAEVAALVSSRAAALAPHRTGRLAASVRGSGQAGAAVVRAGRSAVPYAGPIHFGWAARHIEPHKFIYEAAEETRGTWEAAYLHAINDLIDTIEGAPGP